LAIRNLKNLFVGKAIGGETDRRNIINVDELYFRDTVNIRQTEPALWESRGGFSPLAISASEAIHSQFDYQRAENIDTPGKREHITVAGNKLFINGVEKFVLSSSAPGRFIQWSFKNIAYYFNGKQVIRYNGTDIRLAGLAAPTTAPTAAAVATGGSMSNGAYQFQVTFISDIKRSATGPSSTAVTLSAGTAVQSISLTSIPTGPAGTTARKIYRTAAGGSIFFEDFRIEDNTATTGTSVRADSALGEESDEANDPPLFTIAEIYNDHLFVAGHSQDDVAFSILGNPETWQEDDFIRFPGRTGDVIGGVSALVSYIGRLYIFRRDKIFFVQGNNRDDFITSVNAIDYGPVGVIATDSVQLIDGLIYFLSEDGPYVFDGSHAPRSLSGNVPRKWNPFAEKKKINAQQLKNTKSVYYRHRKEWWLAISNPGSSSLDKIFVYNHGFKTASSDRGGVGNWYKFTSSLFPIKDIAIIEGASGATEDIDRVIIANTTGSLYEHDTISTDDGTAFTWKISTPEIDLNNIVYNKRWWWFTPLFEENCWGDLITIKILFDGLGDRAIVVRYDLGSRHDVSALWNQMVWDCNSGYYPCGPVVPGCPVSLKGKNARYINVHMEGTDVVKFSGYHVAAQLAEFASCKEGQISEAIRY